MITDNGDFFDVDIDNIQKTEEQDNVLVRTCPECKSENLTPGECIDSWICNKCDYRWTFQTF